MPTLTVIPVRNVLTLVVSITVTIALTIILAVPILHIAVAVAVVWAAGAVPVTPIAAVSSVTVTVLVSLPVIVVAATRWRARAAARRALTATRRTAGIEAPACGWWSTSPLSYALLALTSEYLFLRTYLDLQQVVAADALVMHLMVGVVCIAAALVLHECEATVISSPSHVNGLRTHQLTVCSTQCAELECRSGLDVHTFENRQYEVQSERVSLRDGRRRIASNAALEGGSQEGEKNDDARPTARIVQGARMGRGKDGWSDEEVRRIARGSLPWKDVPFELVCQIARACAVAEASHVEGCATARHACRWFAADSLINEVVITC